MRIYTPEFINCRSDLPPNAIVCVGTNFEGRHGLGGAKMANKHFGLEYGFSQGLCGETWAIITKDLQKGKRSVTLEFIFNQVVDSMLHMEAHPENVLYYTRFGSSLAGFKVEEIKSIFEEIYSHNVMPPNIILPYVYEVRA